MISKENKIFRKMFIVTEYAALIRNVLSSVKNILKLEMQVGELNQLTIELIWKPLLDYLRLYIRNIK